MSHEYIRVERDGALTTIVLDRADKRNAFTLAMWQAVPRLLREAADVPTLKLLIVQAAQPGGFCAGADIAELLANKDDAAWRDANQAAINAAQFELTRFALPTIAFVEGDAVGGGCGLTLACDMRVATPAARFGITPAKLGLVYPLHDVKLLVDLVGPDGLGDEEIAELMRLSTSAPTETPGFLRLDQSKLRRFCRSHFGGAL
jgi:enoyl-CoA hydratase/carnithine racemase